MQDVEAARVAAARRRIRRLMVLLGLGGASVLALTKGVGWAAGFLAGACGSVLNYGWLEQVAAGLGPGRAGRRMRWAVLFGLRYVLLGLAGYGIVKVFGFSALAVLAGLLVAAAAVLAEMIYELAHAGT